MHQVNNDNDRNKNSIDSSPSPWTSLLLISIVCLLISSGCIIKMLIGAETENAEQGHIKTTPMGVETEKEEQGHNRCFLALVLISILVVAICFQKNKQPSASNNDKKFESGFRTYFLRLCLG
ncbi:hypothetical protein Cni_G13075 [Canna indica]|uniref:Uncharacterized protein n=1 Tax=Canna indica TaxID=4628 RepID=A0AAQ3KAP2_9LILI|nr:hypothetical protein Cni_G13075 [Canna indica]